MAFSKANRASSSIWSPVYTDYYVTAYAMDCHAPADSRFAPRAAGLPGPVGLAAFPRAQGHYFQQESGTLHSPIQNPIKCHWRLPTSTRFRLLHLHFFDDVSIQECCFRFMAAAFPDHWQALWHAKNGDLPFAHCAQLQCSPHLASS
jgi:hypothetical protein